MKLFYQCRLTKGNACESAERLVFDAVEARLLFSVGGQRSLGETTEKNWRVKISDRLVQLIEKNIIRLIAESGRNFLRELVNNLEVIRKLYLLLTTAKPNAGGFCGLLKSGI